jgi:hypothetical protein
MPHFLSWKDANCAEEVDAKVMDAACGRCLTNESRDCLTVARERETPVGEGSSASWSGAFGFEVLDVVEDDGELVVISGV